MLPARNQVQEEGLLIRRLLPVLPCWLQRTSGTATVQRQGAGVEDLGGTFKLLPLRLEVVLHNACHAGMLRWGTAHAPPSLAILGLPWALGGVRGIPEQIPQHTQRKIGKMGFHPHPVQFPSFPCFPERALLTFLNKSPPSFPSSCTPPAISSPALSTPVVDIFILHPARQGNSNSNISDIVQVPPSPTPRARLALPYQAHLPGALAHHRLHHNFNGVHARYQCRGAANLPPQR